MAKRSYAWWLLAEDLAARLTRPPIDVAGSDRQVERLLQESRLWSVAANLAGAIPTAWLGSRLRSWTRRVKAEWPSDPVLALSDISWMIRVSAATTLAAQALKPAGLDRSSWAVPVAIGLGGAILPWLAAGRIRGAGRPEQSGAEREKP